jgi:hypothetical protein
MTEIHAKSDGWVTSVTCNTISVQLARHPARYDHSATPPPPTAPPTPTVLFSSRPFLRRDDSDANAFDAVDRLRGFTLVRHVSRRRRPAFREVIDLNRLAPFTA